MILISLNVYPVELDDRAALWRSLLAGRRMLIVLDNAATEAQVTPLLPGAAGCLGLITSRCRLAGLEASLTISLDMLPQDDAVALFIRSAGDEALVGGPPEQVATAVELCGRLPLAIRIAAARLKSHSAWTVADLVKRLADQDQRLAEFNDESRSVRRALELSYRQLSVDQQRMYRLLGLHPGADIDSYATSALASLALRQAQQLLDQLIEAHLLQESNPGRYTFHDLVRDHAAAVAAKEVTEPQKREAITRLLDYYRHTASVAMNITYPSDRDRRPRIPRTVSADAAPDFLEPRQSTAWLNLELPNLLAAVRQAADRGWPEYAWHLSATLHRHLRTRGSYRHAETIHRQALVAARSIGNQIGELDALLCLGQIHRLQGRYDEAAEHYQQALSISRINDNHIAELDALSGLSRVHWLRGQYQQAIDHYRPLLENAKANGNRSGELDAVLGLGHIHLVQGRYEQAADHYSRALTTAQAVCHRTGELDALLGLGHVHRRHGHHEQAMEHYQRILDIALQIGDRNWQFEGLHSLGRVHHALGYRDRALTFQQHALELATDLAQPADQARAYDGLAHSYYALGLHEPARHHWQRALDILIDLGIEHTEDEEASVSTIRSDLTNLNHERPPTSLRSQQQWR